MQDWGQKSFLRLSRRACEIVASTKKARPRTHRHLSNMAPLVTDPARSRIMRSVRSKDTRPEKAVRSLLHSLGYRFRLHLRNLPGTPDIVFPGRRKAVWVHGCYWHGHGCKKGRLPKSRLEFWAPKIEANRKRDGRDQEAIHAMGWDSLVIWQCQLNARDSLAATLGKFLGPPNGRRAGPLPPDPHDH